MDDIIEEKRKHFHIIDKDSDVVIICTGKDEDDAREYVKERVKCLDTRFYVKDDEIEDLFDEDE